MAPSQSRNSTSRINNPSDGHNLPGGYNLLEGDNPPEERSPFEEHSIFEGLSPPGEHNSFEDHNPSGGRYVFVGHNVDDGRNMLEGHNPAEGNNPVEQHIPRPPNAFFCYLEDLRREDPSITPKEASIKWHGLSPEKQRVYYEMSEKKKEQHRLNHPGYRYQPRRRNRTTEVSTLDAGSSGSSSPTVQEPALQSQIALVANLQSVSNFLVALNDLTN